MPASTTSAFSNASELEAALRNVGDVRLVVTGRGEFRARLTHVELQRLRLWAVDERASRIGFLKIPPDMLLALFTIGDQPSPIWSGTSLNQGEILTCGPNHRLHMRTEGPSCWGAVSLPADEFRAYFSQLTGQVLTMPIPAQRWRPAAAACKRFMQLHTAAIRAAGMRPQTIVDPEAAHGMEQQLIHSLVGCLSAGRGEDASGPRRCQDVVADLEDLLQSQPEHYADLTALRAALAVSDGHLRRCCKQILGIGPAAYVHLYLSDRPVVLRARDRHRELPCNRNWIIDRSAGLIATCVGELLMPSSAVRVFTDPDEHAAAIRQGVSEMTVTGRGAFRSEIVRIDFHHLWMQRFTENMSRIRHTTGLGGRAVIAFPAQPGPAQVLERRGADAGEPHTPQGRGQLLSPFSRGLGYSRNVAAAGRDCGDQRGFRRLRPFAATRRVDRHATAIGDGKAATSACRGRTYGEDPAGHHRPSGIRARPRTSPDRGHGGLPRNG